MVFCNDYYSTILRQWLQNNDFLQRFLNNDFHTTKKKHDLDLIFNDFCTMIYIQRSIYNDLYTTINLQRFVYNDLYTTINLQRFVYNDLYTTICIQRFVYNDLYTTIILCADTTILALCQRFGLRCMKIVIIVKNPQKSL